ncbi:Shikimate dehydrogenase (NADP(+)) [Candidatus Roizmanbacteria bacterium]|nr:Shikimate dehydrogenase (NADP(+)) [Candidatus Roizmanbacteria bacterium]
MFMKISAKTKICLIIGDPVSHSMSPAMHNAGYEALGIDDRFVFLGAKVKAQDVGVAVECMRKMGIHGLTCTIPHKVEVMKFLDEIDETAKKIGAVNTVLNKNGKLIGFNTDWQGTVIPLEKIISLSGKKVLVLGAGGAARAIVFGLLKKGAKVKIFNRTKEKAVKLAQEFNCQVTSLSIKSEIRDFDIIINTTSVGMKPLEKETPISTKFITNKQIVFDIVYVPFETKLLKEAKKRGARIIHGTEMLLHQGTTQFEIYTGHKAPEEVMRKILYEKN